MMCCTKWGGKRYRNINRIRLSVLLSDMAGWCDERGLHHGDIGYSGTISVSVENIRYLEARARLLEASSEHCA